MKYGDREWNSQDVAVNPTRTRKGRAAEYQIREIDLISSYPIWTMECCVDFGDLHKNVEVFSTTLLDSIQ